MALRDKRSCAFNKLDLFLQLPTQRVRSLDPLANLGFRACLEMRHFFKARYFNRLDQENLENR